MLAGVSNTATAVSLDESIQPIALTLHQNPARADIGRLLFHDPRLSGNGRLSCASCHDTGKGGGDGLARLMEQYGAPGDVNTPPVFNAALNFRQLWNGRADSLETQTDRHVFKVPSLRNVALTAPCFHDASAGTLEEAVDVMFRYQLDRVASRDDKEAIVRFLNTLTGTPEARP